MVPRVTHYPRCLLTLLVGMGSCASSVVAQGEVKDVSGWEVEMGDPVASRGMSGALLSDLFQCLVRSGAIS